MATQSIERRLAAILAADVAGYTRLMEADTDGTVAAWQAAREDVIKPKVAEHAGKIVKLTGDGFLVEFPTVQDAVRCAIALQDGLASSNLDFRMGVNLGDIVDDGEDIHGEGVNIAARLEGLAEPGGICVSGGVYDQVRNRVEAGFRNMGEKKVKNVSAPVRVYSVATEASGRDESQIMRSGEPLVEVLPYNIESANPEQYSQNTLSAEETEKGLKLGGVLIIFLAPGLIVLGWFTDALQPMLGVAALMVFIGIGLLVAARITGPSRRKDQDPSAD